MLYLDVELKLVNNDVEPTIWTTENWKIESNLS